MICDVDRLSESPLIIKKILLINQRNDSIVN